MGATPTDDDIARARTVATVTASRWLKHHSHEGIGVEDVVQEVLLRFVQLDLAEIRNTDAWIVRATKNRCADVSAAARRHGQVPIPGDDAAPDDPAYGRARAVGVRPAEVSIAMTSIGPSAGAMAPMMLAHALSGLSERERELLLRHSEGWSNSEIAQRLGYASAGSVAVSVSRAKAKIRQRFASGSSRAELLNPQRVY